MSTLVISICLSIYKYVCVYVSSVSNSKLGKIIPEALAWLATLWFGVLNGFLEISMRKDHWYCAWNKLLPAVCFSKTRLGLRLALQTYKSFSTAMIINRNHRLTAQYEVMQQGLATCRTFIYLSWQNPQITLVSLWWHQRWQHCSYSGLWILVAVW